MDLPDAKPRNERDETDASLQAEREKADTELAKARSDVDADADRVVEVARERAEATLSEARDRDDRNMAVAGVAGGVALGVERERRAEDKTVALEQDVADERLRAERGERQRALSALLLLEREATDDGLLVERARADETVATRDEFLAMVSHDLRNMLGTIAMSAATIATRCRARPDGGVDAEGARHAERIQRSTARMNRLVGDLLDVVSLESGALRVVPEPHEAADLVKEAMAAFLPSFAAKGLTLTLEPPATSIVLAFDHDRLLQVLANLLSNSFKFTEPGGKVTLSLARVGADARFSVTDTGPGIPAARRTTIFERFQQVTKDGRGLGLGLYISKCIVEAHGGTLWAESHEPRGAALRFTIPAS
ncbi:MAG: HAMP domain-containing histidine kinase [Myxococcales bacterium]|nr:HAMP domain-containing histidine kinase [Myxococcales bacterium]